VVPSAATLARRLVEYDRDLAVSVLAALATELGGVAGEKDLERLHAFLTRPDAIGAEQAKTTVEWKAGFAHHERVRNLALQIAELLRVTS
jgi:hypothetical protein